MTEATLLYLRCEYKPAHQCCNILIISPFTQRASVVDLAAAIRPYSTRLHFCCCCRRRSRRRTPNTLAAVAADPVAHAHRGHLHLLLLPTLLPTHLPITSARVKRIAAWGQTLHHTPGGSPARTGPTHPHAHPSHTRMTHYPRAYPPALLLLSAAAHARPSLAADFAPRTPNQSMPRRKHFTPPLVSALHARDQTHHPPTHSRTHRTCW